MSENVAIAISTFTDHETTIHGNDLAFKITAFDCFRGGMQGHNTDYFYYT